MDIGTPFYPPGFHLRWMVRVEGLHVLLELREPLLPDEEDAGAQRFDAAASRGRGRRR